MATFTDGTSNTAIMSESLQSDAGNESTSQGLGMVYVSAGSALEELHQCTPGNPADWQAAQYCQNTPLSGSVLVEGRIRPLRRT